MNQESNQEALFVAEEEKIHEACGVFGIYDNYLDVVQASYEAAIVQQHRGQEAAGIAVSDGRDINCQVNAGLVLSAFPDKDSLNVLGHGFIGASHVRYGTVEVNIPENAGQPILKDGFTLSHNGHITNTENLKRDYGQPSDCDTDSDVLATIIEKEHIAGSDIVSTLEKVIPDVEGAYSLVITTPDRLIGIRDPNGFRPLHLAKTLGGYALASESSALEVIGGKLLREIDPGEMIIIGDGTHRSVYPFEESRINPALCAFEFVYFSAPDSELSGREVYAVRKEMGRELARQDAKGLDNLKIDIVIGAPDSGTPAAEGYADESGIPYSSGMKKNRYIGRTFIKPEGENRSNAIDLKLKPYKSEIDGKNVLVVDDSIVRANTTLNLVRMLRDAGARSVHVRISSPPYKWPCFYGMDTGDPSQLIASNKSVEEIKDYIGANSLSYLSISRLQRAIGSDTGLCDACMTGNYPTSTHNSH